MSLPAELQAEVGRAWAVQDYAHGRDLLEAAGRQCPDDLHLRSCIAAAHGYCSRFVTARAQVEEILALTPPEKRPLRSGLLAIEWSNIGRPDLAEPLLRQALETGSPMAALFDHLADCLERLKRLPEAQAVLDQGFARYPGHPGLLLMQARVSRRIGDFAAADSALRQIAASPLASPVLKSKASYELGHLRESQGRYADAYRAFTKGKHHQRQEAEAFRPLWKRPPLPDPTQLPQRRDLDRWSKEVRSDPSKRLAFLVGCPRSGTTLLERVLDAHADLIAAPETATFTCEVWLPLRRSLKSSAGLIELLSSITAEQLATARATYWKLMPEALEEPIADRLVLDKNPSLLPALPVIERIFPDAPLLMALRDPRAIAWSCYTQYLPVNSETVAYLDLATTLQQTAAALQGWLDLRDRLACPWHEVRYESVVSDLEGEARRTLEFLGLPWDENVPAYHRNANPVRSPSYAQASAPVYSEAVDRFRHYEEFFEPLRSVWEPITRALGYA